MNRITLASTVLAAGLLIAGCNNYDGTGELTRQEGDIHTKPANVDSRVTTPIPGETTGSGQKVDTRTGGRITGDDLSGNDARKATPVVVPPNERPAGGGPIPTNTEAGVNPNNPRQ